MMRVYVWHQDAPNHFGWLWFVKSFGKTENTAGSRCTHKCGWLGRKQFFVLRKGKPFVVAFVKEHN